MKDEGLERIAVRSAMSHGDDLEAQEDDERELFPDDDTNQAEMIQTNPRLNRNRQPHAVCPDNGCPPLVQTAAAHAQHLGTSRQYMRDVILGVNDGLVSTFLLVAGVAGGGLSSSDILLTAIAGAIAGAVSMCAGEYVATKSQNEVMQGEIALEQEHVARFLEDEVSEVSNLLELIGIPKEEEEITSQLCAYYREHPASLLKIMTALEFGVVQDETRSPIRAGVFSCLLFLIGSLPSVVPFMFSVTPLIGLILAAAITMCALLVVGAVKTWATRGNCVTAAMENLVIASFGGGFAYAVGLAFDEVLHKR